MSRAGRGDRGAFVAALLVGLIFFGLVALAVLVPGYWFAKAAVPKNLGVVEPGVVWRSGQVQPHLIGGLIDQYRIERVINLQQPSDDAGQVAELAALDERGIEMLRFPMFGDGVGTVETYAGAVAALAESARDGKRTLIHCTAGAQRTGGVVATYRTLVEGWTVEEALAEAERYGWEPAEDTAWPQWLDANVRAVAERLGAGEPPAESWAAAAASR